MATHPPSPASAGSQRGAKTSREAAIKPAAETNNLNYISRQCDQFIVRLIYLTVNI